MQNGFKATLIILGLASTWPANAQQPVSWKQYADGSGTRVALPVSVFENDEGPPEQGNGRKFRNANGNAQLSIYSLPNPAGESPARYLHDRLKVSRATIKYQRVTPRFFVLSSVKGGFIYYSRCNFSRTIHCIYITYPEQEKRAWDSIVTRISNSLRSHG